MDLVSEHNQQADKQWRVFSGNRANCPHRLTGINKRGYNDGSHQQPLCQQRADKGLL